MLRRMMRCLVMCATASVLSAGGAVQVTPRIAVSPTLQVIIDPARNPDEDSLFAAGVRTRVAF